MILASQDSCTLYFSCDARTSLRSLSLRSPINNLPTVTPSTFVPELIVIRALVSLCPKEGWEVVTDVGGTTTGGLKVTTSAGPTSHAGIVSFWENTRKQYLGF